MLNAQNNLLKRDRLLTQTAVPMECSQCREFHQNNHVTDQMSLEGFLAQAVYEKEQSELLIVHQKQTIDVQKDYINRLEKILNIPISGGNTAGIPSSVHKEYISRPRIDSIDSGESSSQLEEAAKIWKTPDWPIIESWNHLPITWDDSKAETRAEETPVSSSSELPLPPPYSRKGKERASAAYPIHISDLGHHMWATVLNREAHGASIEGNTVFKDSQFLDDSETNPVSSSSGATTKVDLLLDRHF
jgi:hypothetical protein